MILVHNVPLYHYYQNSNVICSYIQLIKYSTNSRFIGMSNRMFLNIGFTFGIIYECKYNISKAHD
jgi:hypothetical protein